MFKRVALACLIAASGLEWPCNNVAPIGEYSQATCEASCQAAKAICEREGLKDNDSLFSCISRNTNVTRCVYHTAAYSSDSPTKPWYKKPVTIGSATAGVALLASAAGYGYYKRRNAMSGPVDETTALSEGAYYNKNGVLVDANGNPINVADGPDAF